MSRELREAGARHFWPHMRPAGDFSDETGTKVIVRGEGIFLEDDAGRRYIDTLSGLWNVAAGHGRRELARVAAEQLEKLAFTPGGTTSEPAVRLAAKVASLYPDKDARVLFVNGGSEANETALKMVRRYHALRGEPGRFKILSRRDSYHGATYACMSMSGGNAADFGPLVPGHVLGPQLNPAKCAFCSAKTGCTLRCEEDLEALATREDPSTIAALIVEPMSAPGGLHVAPADYFKRLRAFCDRTGILLIADEVLTGFGRTGRWFAMENFGVVPDLTTVAKGITSGYAPLAAVIARKHVADTFIGGDAKAFRHIVTTGGNPVGCAVGLANLELLEREKLVERAAERGQQLRERLKALPSRLVADVRGLGLLNGIDFVKNRATGERFPVEAGFPKKLNAFMATHGLLGRAGDVWPLAPPLCITESEVDLLVDRVGAVLGELEAVFPE